MYLSTTQVVDPSRFWNGPGFDFSSAYGTSPEIDPVHRSPKTAPLQTAQGCGTQFLKINRALAAAGQLKGHDVSCPYGRPVR